MFIAKLYTCSCLTKFTTKAMLARHKKLECGRQLKCFKENCNQIYTTVAGLQNHIKSMHFCKIIISSKK